MDKLTMIKKVGGLVTSIAVGVVVSNIIKSTTPIDIKPLNKALVFIGGAVLSSMICGKASDHIEDRIEKTLNEAKEVVEESEQMV